MLILFEGLLECDDVLVGFVVHFLLLFLHILHDTLEVLDVVAYQVYFGLAPVDFLLQLGVEWEEEVEMVLHGGGLLEELLPVLVPEVFEVVELLEELGELDLAFHFLLDVGELVLPPVALRLEGLQLDDEVVEDFGVRLRVLGEKDVVLVDLGVATRWLTLLTRFLRSM